MKVYFASLSDMTLEVDAYVPTIEQGLAVLDALRTTYADHVVVMRARLKKYRDYEERYIGAAGENAEVGDFLRRVSLMGLDEPTKEGDAS